MPAPEDLPPLRDVIAAYDLAAKKSLGQHFLLDLNITRKIVRLAQVASDDWVVEVGPGPGGLTRALLEAGANVVAIERDARAIAALRDVEAAFAGRLRIVEGDALKSDYRQLTPDRCKVISNLPYNISTELLIGWLRMNHDAAPPFWSSMALMFQKEVADRILAEPGSKAYGRLSVIAQAASRPTRGFDLPARAFTPPPKVDSTVVVFASAPKISRLTALEAVTQAAFSQRRKMLRTSLKPTFGAATEDALNRVGLAPTARAETVSVDAFLALAQLV